MPTVTVIFDSPSGNVDRFAVTHPTKGYEELEELAREFLPRGAIEIDMKHGPGRRDSNGAGKRGRGY